MFPLRGQEDVGYLIYERNHATDSLENRNKRCNHSS